MFGPFALTLAAMGIGIAFGQDLKNIHRDFNSWTLWFLIIESFGLGVCVTIAVLSLIG